MKSVFRKSVGTERLQFWHSGCFHFATPAILQLYASALLDLSHTILSHLENKTKALFPTGQDVHKCLQLKNIPATTTLRLGTRGGESQWLVSHVDGASQSAMGLDHSAIFVYQWALTAPIRRLRNR